MVEYLIQCHADVQATDDGGLVPLHNACSFGHADVVMVRNLFSKPFLYTVGV